MKLALAKTARLVMAALLSISTQASAAVLFQDSFNRADGLVTNEYAFSSLSDPRSVQSPDWQMDSGSFFIQGGAGWTGLPDDIVPNVLSSQGTDSAIFRLTTKRSDFGDVAVSFQLLNQGLTTTGATPAVDWDGVHIWLHYQSEFQLYYASINRRDNTVIIKKKVPGGPDNGGTYYELSPYVSFHVAYNAWQNVAATVKNNTNGSVTISLYSNSALLVTATDNGSLGGAPIVSVGKVGIRGDNANFKIKNFQVASLDNSGLPPSPPPLPPPSQTNLNQTTTSDPANPRVFPNPWRADKNGIAPVVFDHLPSQSSVSIFTISGHRVKQLASANSSATWDLTNDRADKVASGLYIYRISNDNGSQTTGKLAIIR